MGALRYDETTGQLAAATLMDYDALPRTDALPSFVTELREVPSTSNLLGLHGGGEGTPERVWRAIHGAAW